MRTSKTLQILKIERILKLYATLAVSFSLAFSVSSILSPVERSGAIECENGIISGGSASDICGTDTTDVNVSIAGAWTISVSSSGTLGLNLTPNSSGTLSTVVDNLNVYTNTPNGYQLYLNSTSGSTDIYNNNILDESGNIITNPSSNPDGSGIINTNHFSATTGTKTSPVALTNNTWGYTLADLGDNPSQSTLSSTTFSKVETTSSTADSNIYTNPAKTSTSGDNIDVTYGFMADTKLTPGTYSTQVTYTAVADTPAYTIQTISPSTINLDQGETPITIVTTTPSTELGLGEVAASITNAIRANNIDLPLENCEVVITDIAGTIITPTAENPGYWAARCTYPGGTVEQGGLPVGTYSIELTSSWHSSTYLFTDALTVTSPYTITSVTPDVGNNNAETTITIITDTLTSNSTAFGTVTGKIGNTNMSNCSATTSGNYRAVQCTIPSGVTAGTYTVQFTAAGHSSTTYSKASAVTIRAYLTVSGGSGSGWYAPNTTVNISASACSTNYRFNNWTTTGGTLASSTSASTTITTTTSNITVNRNCIINPYLTVSGGSGSGYYAPNSTINISASACPSGQKFSKWTTTGGTLGNANASSTTIKIGSSNVTVTRNCTAKTSCSEYATNETGTLKGYAVKKLADGKCWQTVNYRSNVAWANRGSCPSGFVFPSVTDFEALINQYGRGGNLYRAWGLSSDMYFLSSTTNAGDGRYNNDLFVGSSYANVFNWVLTTETYTNVRCYTTS